MAGDARMVESGIFTPRLIVPRLTTDDLRAWLAKLPPEYTQDYGRRHFNLFTHVIHEFLGKEWLNKNLFAHALRPDLARPFGFLELDFATDEIRENKSLRIFDLAEILLNLQLIEGFDDCLKRLRDADAEQVESTFAELQVGKLLYIHDVNFRFVPQTGEKGADYDYDVEFAGGWKAAAEAKCRIESQSINPKAVKSLLDQARKQLPENKPGIIFVKVPQHWFVARNEMAAELRAITREFLRGTGRVVSVKFYVSHVSLANQQTIHRHAYDELNNPNARFARKYWDIFKGYYVPKEWNGMPPKWIRLMNFK
jgi:hypothetical protein